MNSPNRIFSWIVATLLLTMFVTSVEAQRIRLSGPKKEAVSLDWFLKEESLWTKTADDLEKSMGSTNFIWQEKERTNARFNPDNQKLTLNGVKVGETLVRLKDGKISSVTISYLNKGDDRRLDRGVYTDAISAAKAAVVVSGGDSMVEEKRPHDEQVTKASTILWRGSDTQYLLEHLFLEEETFKEDGWIWKIPPHAEFVRLRLLPRTSLLGRGVEKFRTSVSRPKLRSLVKRTGKKAVIEGIPMVNQGSKGYCAVASLERVIRYYGADIDMHDLANLANTYGGTNPNEMKQAVREVAKKLRMSTSIPLFTTPKDIKKLAKDYNKMAKKAGRKSANENAGFFVQANNELVKKIRLSSSDYLKFKREVVDSINRGIPVLWALHLGLFWEDKIEGSHEANRYAVNKPKVKKGEEADKGMAEILKKWDEERKAKMEKMRKELPRPPGYMQGGHMRIIVGYDGAEGVIYYTDSWGPGHEMKKMSLDEAFAATHAIMSIEPR